MTRLYAYGGFLRAHDSAGRLWIGPAWVVAANEEEALGAMLKHCRELFPTSGGYGSHGVDAVGIPDEEILKVAEGIKNEKT